MWKSKAHFLKLKIKVSTRLAHVNVLSQVTMVAGGECYKISENSFEKEIGYYKTSNKTKMADRKPVKIFQWEQSSEAQNSNFTFVSFFRF